MDVDESIIKLLLLKELVVEKNAGAWELNADEHDENKIYNKRIKQIIN